MSLIDSNNVFESPAQIAGIPPWWRTFVFQVLNGRQLAVYLYLLTLMGEDGHCSPTTRQIAWDMGLMGATMVFDAMNVLEEYGFILRSRSSAASPNGARRNVYQRPSCGYTLLQLLRRKRISPELLCEEGLQEVLGAAYRRYASLPPLDRRPFLTDYLASRGYDLKP